MDSLIHIGLFRKEGEALLLDAPVFLREDAAYLRRCFAASAARMAGAMAARGQEFKALAGKLDNGFPASVNLYHLVCGGVLDGSFFDCISREGLVAASRIHESGLDYLIIAYEKSRELEGFSQKLLCSYNRFTDGARTLQSFGDADGDRVDAFRFARQKQLGKVPGHLKHLEELWDSLGDARTVLLEQVQELAETGRCEGRCRELLDAFGYLEEGRIAVHVYRGDHQTVFQALEALTEECILGQMRQTLSSPDIFAGLVCSSHGVSRKEIANELYHVVFGQINERLVEEGFAARPPYEAGQGRCLKSIKLL